MCRFQIAVLIDLDEARIDRVCRRLGRCLSRCISRCVTLIRRICQGRGFRFDKSLSGFFIQCRFGLLRRDLARIHRAGLIAFNQRADARRLKNPFRRLDTQPTMHKLGFQRTFFVQRQLGDAATNTDRCIAGIKLDLLAAFGQHAADKAHGALFNTRAEIAVQLFRVKDKFVNHNARRRTDIHARAVNEQHLRAASLAGFDNHVLVNTVADRDDFQLADIFTKPCLRNDGGGNADFGARLRGVHKRTHNQGHGGCRNQAGPHFGFYKICLAHWKLLEKLSVAARSS